MIEYPNMTGRDCHGTTESTCLNSISFVEKSVTSKSLQELYIHFLLASQQRCPPQFGSFCCFCMFLFVFIHNNMTAYKPKMFASARALVIRKCEIISTSMPFSTASFGKKEHLSHPSLDEKPRFLQAW